MATTKTIPQARIDRFMAEADAAFRATGEELTAADRAAGRRILSGEATAEQVIAEGFAELEAKYGFTR